MEVEVTQESDSDSVKVNQKVNLIATFPVTKET